MPRTTLANSSLDGVSDGIEINCSRRRMLLVVGGGGGVGSMIIQFAKKLCGLFVVATCSTLESVQHCKQMGADLVWHHPPEVPIRKSLLTSLKKGELPQSLQEKLAEHHSQGVIDYIVCCHGILPGLWDQICENIAPNGRIGLLVGGNGMKNLDLNFLFYKNVRVVFEVVFGRARFDSHLEHQGSTLDIISRLLDLGIIAKPKIMTVADWRDIVMVHKKMERGHNIGKTTVLIEQPTESQIQEMFLHYAEVQAGTRDQKQSLAELDQPVEGVLSSQTVGALEKVELMKSSVEEREEKADEQQASGAAADSEMKQ